MSKPLTSPVSLEDLPPDSHFSQDETLQFLTAGVKMLISFSPTPETLRRIAAQLDKFADLWKQSDLVDLDSASEKPNYRRMKIKSEKAD